MLFRSDPFVGQLAFFRVYSGHLDAGSGVYNSTKQSNERVGRLLKMHANKREEIKEVFAGDIAAAVGLRDVTTGDTICDENKQILLESMDFPEPVSPLRMFRPGPNSICKLSTTARLEIFSSLSMVFDYNH